MLSPHLHNQLFPKTRSFAKPKYLTDLSSEHLKRQNISPSAPTNPLKEFSNESIQIPPLIGSSIREHFANIASHYCDKYKLKIEQFINKNVSFDFPSDELPVKSGWTKCFNGQFTQVPYPEEELVVLDVEIVPKESQFPILATAVTKNAWYYWISEEFLSGNPLTKLIPIGKGKLIIGHNVSFDRAKLLEEYSIENEAENRFLCTMALHSAVAGLSSHQRNEYGRQMKLHEAEFECDRTEPDKWVFASSYNSLKDCLKFHLKKDLDKEVVKLLVDGSLESVRGQLQQILQYCFNDSRATAELFAVLWPKFQAKCPHPVTFAGLLEMGSMILPTRQSVWSNYVKNADHQYICSNERVVKVLEELVAKRLDEGTELGADGISQDPWLSFLDWTIIPETFTIARYKKDGTYAAGGKPRPKGNSFFFNKPLWYKQAYNGKGEFELTLNSRLTQTLLKLTWKGHAVIYSPRHGWCYGIAKDSTNNTTTSDEIEAKHPIPSSTNEDGFVLDGYPRFTWFRVPHATGEEGSNVGSMMSKGFFPAYESGVLSSGDPMSKEFLRMLMQENISGSFWKSYQERVKEQFTVSISALNGKQPEIQSSLIEEELNNFQSLSKNSSTLSDDSHQLNNNANTEQTNSLQNGTQSQETRLSDTVSTQSSNPNDSTDVQLIIPQVCPMGTVTRRAVEKTWMTAAEAKPHLIGTELKSRIVAPPGFVIVGADVDSQELWIASVMGDSQFGWHASTALGWMTLQGNRADKTDMHSRTAQILGISRNDAKIFNYGRIYGAGAKSSALLLQRQNPSLTEGEAKERVSQLFVQTKGKRVKWENSFIYQGGTESFMFNVLESEANSELPRTPALSASISEALIKKNVDHSFITSRVNWVVQSSGVDYLHMLLCSMAYLISRFSIKARLMLTIHDEIRYLVQEEDQWRAALALQISNLWTRCMFAAQLGMDDLPLSVGFFSAVDVDKVLRKEPALPCLTPSSTVPVEPGQSVDIYQLTNRVKSLGTPIKGQSPPTRWTEQQLNEKFGVVRPVQRIELIRKQIGQDCPTTSNDTFPTSNPINEQLYKK